MAQAGCTAGLAAWPWALKPVKESSPSTPWAMLLLAGKQRKKKKQEKTVRHGTGKHKHTKNKELSFSKAVTL